MGINNDKVPGIVEVLTPVQGFKEISVESTSIEVINTTTNIEEQDLTTYHIDVLRKEDPVHEIENRTETTELYLPGLALVNVGAGPQLPTGYEGQIWILT